VVNRIISVGDDFTLPASVKTTDANLPAASNAAAVALKLDANKVGAASGVAPLGADSKVPDASLPTRLGDVALNAAIGLATEGLARPRGNTLVITGDSRMAGELTGSDAGTEYRVDQQGIFTWANLFLRQRFSVLKVTGIVGNKVSDLLARYQTDVLAYQPQNVLIGIGVNSVTNNVPTETIKSELTQIFALNDSIGATTIILTINPRDAHTAGQRTSLVDVNRWLLNLSRRGVIVIDVTSAVVTATDMIWKTGYTNGADGLHQNRTAAARMGKRIADVLEPLYPARDRLPVYAGDTQNVVANPFMDGAGTVATGWSSIGGTTKSLVAPTDLVPGNWQRIETSGAETVQLRQMTIACPPAWIGKKIAATFEVKLDTVTALTNMQLQCNQLDGGGATIMSTSGPYLNPGDAGVYELANLPGLTVPTVFRTPDATVKAAAVTLQFLFQLSGFNGVVRVRRGSITLVD